MSKLEELIKEFCPNGVECKSLLELVDIHKGIQFNKKDMAKEGLYPVINGGIAPSGYIENYNEQENTITISQGGASAGYVNWLLTKFWAGAHCYVVKPLNNGILDNRYLFHFIKNNESILKQCQYGAGIPALAKSTIQELQIPLPALPVQREIVRILDSFTLYSAELTAELTARRKQYEFYRDKLLNFNHVQYKEVALLELLCQSIADGPHETPVFVDSGIPFISAEAIHDTRIDFSKIRGFISSEYNEQCNKKYKPQINDVFMVKSGSTTGKVAMVTDSREFNIWSPIAAMRTNTSLLPRYLFYTLQTKDIQNQVVKYASNGSQPNLSMRKLEQFKIKVPPMDMQERIVKVLDNFDAICSDLGIGLPAEIEKRQKQYEYYREKLLTFDMNPATIFNGTERNGTERNGTERNGTGRAD